jgi:transposase
MINQEKVMDIKSLAKQGYKIRHIARITGLHRNTIKKYLEGTLPVYKKSNRESCLKSYYGLIEGWLQQQNYQASRIYELLQAQGFKGSYDVVQRHVKKLKDKRDHVAYVRFETLPGQQAQVDFGDFVISCSDGSKLTIYCFLMVLGYSRKMYIEFIDRCTLANFLKCHQKAFEYFGGLPCEILYDNMKNVVIKKMVGLIKWNASFMAFCLHYGFKPLTTPAYSPWAKGKVERPIGYVRERFWRGYQYTDLKYANKDIGEWLKEVADDRIHGTTHEKVSLRFEKEKPFLGPLPPNAYDISEKLWRTVYKDCQVAFDCNRYVVPHEYVGRDVLLKINDGELRIFLDDKLLVTYKIPEGKGKTLGAELYERLKKDKDQIKRKYRKPFFKKAWATRGLLSGHMDIEVRNRPLSEYQDLLDGGDHA